MRFVSWPVEVTDWATWKSPLVERVLDPTVVGLLSSSCWRKVGVRVVPQRGARAMGVGMADARAMRVRAKVVAEASMVKVETCWALG